MEQEWGSDERAAQAVLDEPPRQVGQFVREFRSFNQNTPVIVISGLPDADQEYTGLNVVFRLKPCDPEDLIALVRKAIESPPYRATA